MAQQVVRCRTSFLVSDSLEDMASFDVYFEATGSDVNLDFSTPDTPLQKMTTFLTGTVGSQVNALDKYLSPAVSRATNATTLTWTDVTAHLDGSPAGAPFRTDTLTLPDAAGGGGLPAGAATCVGYRRAYGTDLEHGPATALPSTESAIDQGAPATHTGGTRPRARDRGRFYWGPLNTETINTGTGDPASAYLADVAAAADGLFSLANALSANQFNAVQWSRRNASVGAVAFYYVDEGYTYQRRRGDDAVSRVHSWVAV